MITVSAKEEGFHGAETDIRAVPGLRVVRVTHPPKQRIDVHAHDWACLTVFRCGSYTEQIAAGEMLIDAPSVVFHPNGQQHANRIGRMGLETTSFLFDPRLLRDAVPARSLRDGRIWGGGVVARAARNLLREAVSPAADPAVSISRFLRAALVAAKPPRIPSWLAAVRRSISRESLSTAQLAYQLNLHPAWLARAYLNMMGESIQATIRRHKVERALVSVRGTHLTFAQIAAEAGFCDQSHMVRCFHAVIGRAPYQVRAESGRVA
jgi:AraC family transcriptional regulator